MDEAARETYVKYVDEMTQFAAALVGPFTADDVSSSALQRALSSDRWRAAGDVRAYLFRCVANEAHSQRRSTQRRIRREIEFSRRAEQSTNTYVRIEVLDAIRRLSVQQRSIVYLIYWLDCDIKQTADMLGISSRTVERQHSRARKTLEVLLK